MTLEMLQDKSIQLADAIFESQGKHLLLKKNRFNPGYWKNTWKNRSAKEKTTAEATIFVALLYKPFAVGKNSKNLWPWEDRKNILKDDDAKDWISVLVELDKLCPIYVDLIPGLGVWICDVFNRIPRDVWSPAAHLISQLFINSKILFNALPTEVQTEFSDSSLFFQGIEHSMTELFCTGQTSASTEDSGQKKSNKKSKRSKSNEQFTTRQVFCKLSKEEANRRYGEHSHVHRHGLYLLFQLAKRDDFWQGVVFDSSAGTLKSSLLKIKDASCLSVLYTAIFETACFRQEHRTIDWSAVLDFGIPNEALCMDVPKTISIEEATDYRSMCQQYIESHLLTASAVDSNIQLVTRLFDEQRQLDVAESSATIRPFLRKVERWIVSDTVECQWTDTEYDYLAKWLTNFHIYSNESLFSRRLAKLKSWSVIEQRTRFIETYKIFVDAELYPLLTNGERKQAFFDLWWLSGLDSMFEFGFTPTLLEYEGALVFDHVEGLNESILTYVHKRLIKSKGTNWTAYTRQVVILAILLHGSRHKCHNGDEVAQLLRDGTLADLFIVTDQSSTQDNRILKNTKKIHFASPIAIWLLREKHFRGYRTPILSQITQEFIFSCASETQKFNLFWRLSLYESDGELYKLFAKNLQFKFHLLGAQPLQYTQIRWGEMCKALSIHEHNRQWLSNPKVKKQKTFTFSTNLECVSDFSILWSKFLAENHNVLDFVQSTHWNEDAWSSLLTQWQTCKSTEISTVSLLESAMGQWIRFFHTFHSVLSSILHEVPLESSNDQHLQPVSDFVKQLELLVSKLKRGLKNEFDIELSKLISHSPQVLRYKVPFVLNLLYSEVVKSIQSSLQSLVEQETRFLEFDEDIQSEYITFNQIESRFKDNPHYWEHALRVFEKNRVEQFIAQAWIDTVIVGNQVTRISFDEIWTQYLSTFDSYPGEQFQPHQILCKQLTEQPNKIRRVYHPLLSFICDKMQAVQTETTDNKTGPKWIVVSASSAVKDATLDGLDKELRKQDLHRLADRFSHGHVISAGSRALRFTMHHVFTPFIASVLSLTQLLDFGGNLLQLYKDFPVSSISVTAIASLAFAFGYPFLAKHRDMGLRFGQSFANMWPSFLVSLLMSVGLAIIWAEADGDANFGLPTILLMLFFTTIVKAGIDGAFDTDKD